MTVREVVRIIDDATRPTAMGVGEALEFLEELSSEIIDRIDGLRADLESGAGK